MSMSVFEGFDNFSKVWIYTSPRLFSPVEIDFINEQLSAFCSQWAAHGTRLKAGGTVLEGRFIAIVADESETNASGCSIDTSVRFMKDLSKELQVDLFGRMVFYSETFEKIHFSDLQHFEGKVYNSLVKDLSDFRNNWLVPADSLFQTV